MAWDKHSGAVNRIQCLCCACVADHSVPCNCGLVLDAAVSGQGAALIRDDLRSGRPMRLFDIEVADDYGYCLVVPTLPRSPVGAALTMLEAWLRAAFAVPVDADQEPMALAVAAGEAAPSGGARRRRTSA
jgi:hypothetical protein